MKTMPLYQFTAFFTFSFLLLHTVTSTRVTLDKNGYSNIVVAVSPDIPSTNANKIIDNIKYMITRASAVLFRATEQRAYFKDVRILVPESWNVLANESTWETYDDADVRVAPPNFDYGDKPYTVQSRGCGQPGELIHVTPNYLLSLQEQNNIAQFGPPEKIFVHEWARLRYGVFEEHGIQGSKNFPLFYRPESFLSSIVPNLCTDKKAAFTTRDVVTQGPCKMDPLNDIYDANCVYDLQPEFNPQSSLMANFTISSVVHFCKDDSSVLKHVYDAPNKHNTMCRSKSTWTVISSHQDFYGNNNLPSNQNGTDPIFTVVRPSGSRFVLVADVSTSMDDFDRITKLYDASRRWIQYDIKEGSRLGLVEFSDTAALLSNLTLIDGEDSRNQLISRLPQQTISGTCIGCGLLMALEIFKTSGRGGIILLVTDGLENVPPYIADALPKLIEAEVRVVSIAFGQEAETLIEDLAMKTDGKSYFVNDSDTGEGLNDAFYGSLTYQPAVPSDQMVIVLFKMQYVDAHDPIEGTFLVDSTVGKNFVFRIDYSKRSYIKSFNLTSPSGKLYSELDFDDSAKVAFLKLPMAEVGQWNFKLDVADSFATDTLAVTVSAQTRSNITLPITTECYVSEAIISNISSNPVIIFAKVWQGMNAVTGAKVNAYIQPPTGPTITVELFDNGIFADISKDDGIYSRFFVAASVAGRYTLECEISGKVPTNSEGTSQQLRNQQYQEGDGTEVFSRKVYSESFKVTDDNITEENPYTPAKIVDLTVTTVNSINMNVTLQFTAPGNVLDYGNVSRYEIRYSSVFDDVHEDNFGIKSSTLVTDEDIINGPVTPSESGTKETVSFFLRKFGYNTTCFIAMRGVDDEAGKAGAASNIVSVFVASETVPPEAGGLSVGGIVGIVMGSVMAVLLITGAAYFVIKKRN